MTLPPPVHLYEDGLYWAPQVAELLFGRSADWFYRHRAKLQTDEGFPHPVSRIGRPRWSGRALIGWRDRHAAVAPPSGVRGEPARPAEPHSPSPPLGGEGRGEGATPDYTNILSIRAHRIAHQGKRP